MTTNKTYQDYETPTQLISDRDLMLDEKIQLLESWVESEEALARAAAEGLSGGEQGNLARVQKALMGLKEEAEKSD